MSISKIHVNSSTSMTLNDRFTAIQSSGPKINNSIQRINQRRSKNIAGIEDAPKASLANRKFLQRLEQKHKIQTALKLKRRSLKANMSAKQRIRNNRTGLKKGVSKAIRLTPSGKLIRSNSLSNIATMKADLVAPALKRSNSVSNIVTRLGSRKLIGNSGTTQLPRRQIKRSASNQRQARSRSRSVSNLRRTNSKMNLRQTNTRQNLNRARDVPQKIINRNNFSNQRKRKLSMNGRLGRPNTNLPQRRLNQSGNGAIQGRAPFKRRNSTNNNMNRSGAKQGRISRPRGRNNSTSQRGGRSRSRSRIGNNSVQSRRGGRARNPTGKRGNQQERGRNRNQIRGGRAQKIEIKKEDLDKELDQYMANTKTALDKEMDAYMTGSDI